MGETTFDLKNLMENLGYRFKNTLLLKEALRHSSFVNEQNDKNITNNERLEFLGDAVLNLAVSHLLMQHYPDINEGDLSRMRASLVNESQLAKIARSIRLGSCIQLGKGEIQSNGFNKKSILADALEAVIAGIYLDGGYNNAFEIIKGLFKKPLHNMDKKELTYDYKSRVQELAQLNQTDLPHYTVIDEFGPDHDKTFIVKISLGDFHSRGMGKSKKAAEQTAAKNIYLLLQKDFT